MRVERLRLFSFRNFARAEIALEPHVNVLVGKNGQGKTNLLEAIYFLGFGRSFRTSAPRECIRHSGENASVWGLASSCGIEREIEVVLTPTEKRLLVHRKEVPIDQFVGNLHVLAFTSEHLRIVRGGPSERRAFLDRAMVTVYPGHIRHLATFNRALRQRNSLLRASGAAARADERLLETWDETLVQEGAAIVVNRRRYVAEMKSKLETGLFGGEDLGVRYASSVASDDDASVADAFRRRLAQTRAADARAGFTTAGPHRDDLKLTLDGRPLADFGSAGQQRSGLLALYFAQMEVHRAMHGHSPIFLFDDVEAELDASRIEVVLDHLVERTQTFFTTAKEFLLPKSAARVARFDVEAGRVQSSRPSPFEGGVKHS